MSAINDFVTRRPRLPLAAVPPIDADDPDAVTAADESAMESDIAAVTARQQTEAARKREVADALRIRDECRSDAATVVARAIKRGGRDPMIVAPNDAAIIWIISEFLQKVADQKIEALDPAFSVPQRPSDTANRAVERAMHAVDEATPTEPAGTPGA
jgi:hypothetical protein